MNLPGLQSKRDLFNGAMHAVGLTRVWRRSDLRQLTVLGYHRIKPDHDWHTAFEPDVYGPTAAVFRGQMEWLKRYAHVVSEGDVINHLDGKCALPPNAVLVTFDDGYVDNYTLALPILKQLGMPAVFFVPTGLIDKRELGWWDVVAFMLQRSGRQFVAIRGRYFNLRSPAERLTAISFVQRLIKLTPYEQTKAIIDELSVVTGVERPSAESQSAELMTWEQLKDAANHGVTTASHCVTHRVLATLSAEEQARELFDSRRVLAERLGMQVRTVAYPVGGTQHFTPETEKLAAAAGYEAAFSFESGINGAEIVNRWAIRRIAAPLTVAGMAAQIAWAKAAPMRQELT